MSHNIEDASLGELLGMTEENELRAEVARLSAEKERLRERVMTLAFLAESLHSTAVRPGFGYQVEFDRAYEALPDLITEVRGLFDIGEEGI